MGISCRRSPQPGHRCPAVGPLSRTPPLRRAVLVRAEKGDNADNKSGSSPDKREEYVEALKKGGIDQKTARNVLEKWKEAGAEGDPNLLRSLFLKQSLVPISATLVQLLFDAGAAYSIFMTAGLLALGPDFFGRVPVVFLLDFLSIYFAFGVLFDVVTLTSVLITTAKLGSSPLAFYDAIKAIAASQGSTGAEGLKIVEKAKAAVSSIKVAQALDAIAKMLDAAADGPGAQQAAAGEGKATKSVDTLTNLSAYLTLYRAESREGFDPLSVGMSEKEAANIALAFGQYDLDDNGKLDSNEFVKMLQSLGTDVSKDEADAAMEVSPAGSGRLGVKFFLSFSPTRTSQCTLRVCLAVRLPIRVLRW